MRQLALALLVAASGCNQVFDLKPTIPYDAAPDSPDAPFEVEDRLLWGIAATNTTGAPIAPIYKAIGSESARDMVPTIFVGPPLADGPLMAANYDITDGSFQIPYNLREAPHRIVYTLPNETVPHEIQWSIAGAVIVIPRTTRFDAPNIPAGAGYTITPTGLSGSLTSPSIATTGVFTQQDRTGPFPRSGATTTYDFAANADMMTTPRGAPQGSLGDYVILGEWVAHTGYESLGGFALTHIDLAAGTQSPPQTQPAWMSGSAVNRNLGTALACPDCFPNIDVTTANNRFDALGSIGAGTRTQTMSYGISPTTKLPAFVPGTSLQNFLAQPLIIPFLTAPSIVTSMTLADPTSMLPFDRVVTVQFATKRTVSGADLYTAMEVMTNVFTGQVEVKAPLARQIKLGTNDLSTADGLMINPSSQATALTWADEPSVGNGDDYIVTLYEITANRLAPIRIYHVLTPSVTVDGSLLSPSHQYVFSIQARSGLSKAKQGNYGADTVTFPFTQATTFTAAFNVKP
ncbi:MAG TPA: hypothetical protein VMZ53_33530 [Kofleriaceae bacterium]|nr:hypothetical protein [Kofleriaceae bacterium]